MGQQQINLRHNLHSEFILAHTLDQHTLIANKIFSNEPEIDRNYMKLVLEAMVKNGWSKEDVIKEHERCPKKRLWRIICGKR